MRRGLRPALLVAAALAGACGGRACGGLAGLPPTPLPTVRRGDGREYRLLDKGAWKGYYDAQGRIVGSREAGEKAGLKPGDKVLSVNGTPVTDFDQMAGIIYQQVEKPVLVQWERKGQILQKEIKTFKEKVYDETGQSRLIGKIGIGPVTTHHSLNLFESFTKGIDATLGLCGQIFTVLYGLITGALSLKTLGGPIFIAQAAGQTAQQGISALLFFTALLSVNLAILNLLPIPVLDGGHLLFLAIEKIRRRPLTVKQRTVMQQVGMGFLLVLILFITYNDIFRLLGK